MNKTETINLAGINFYIDEEAYKKLENYLNAISASLHDESRAETMQDIEARIAELFLEKRKDPNEVFGMAEIESVIGVMGQPEDFQVDETIFEEEESEQQKTKRSKKLYRDVDHKTIAGVCAGLSHYFDISIFWVRVLFLVLLIPSASSVVLVYIILWIVTPAAITTSEKLNMQGEKINIDNIERQVREGFSNFKNNVENTDYSGVKGFFNALKTIIFAIALFIAKAIGVVLVLIGGFGLLAILFSFLSAGTFTIFDAPWIDYITAADIGVPFWVASSLVFLFIGIPLFFLFLLGLKILVSKLKSIGFTANAVLLGLWILSIFALSALGIRQATLRAFDAQITQVKTFQLNKTDTLKIELHKSNPYLNSFATRGDFLIKTDSSGNKVIFSNDVDLTIRSTAKNARLEIYKSAHGNGYQDAKTIASKIIYDVDFKNDTLFLENYFTTDIKNKFKYQNVDLMLYLPGNMLFSINGKMNYFAENIPSDYFDHILNFKNQKIECVDCPISQENESEVKNDTIILKTKNVKLRKSKMHKDRNKSSESEWYQENSKTNSVKPPKTK